MVENELLDVDAVQSRQAAIVAALTSPNNLNLTATRLPPTITLTPAEIAPRLKVQVVPESRLISVSFDDPDPRTAAAVANAVMGQRNPPGVTVVAVAAPPAKPLQNRLYFVGGSAVGLLLGIAIVALRWK